MWATWVVAVVALAAVAFMLRFLAALLREGAPSVCYWVVPVCRELKKKEEHLKVSRGIYFDDDCRATESECGDYMVGERTSCERKMYLRSYCSRRLSCF